MLIPASGLRAAIDIGTNSVRLLVADVSSHPPRRLAGDLRITRLGEGLDRTGRIAEEAAARTEAAVSDFSLAARRHGAEPRAFGTLALREAANGSDVAGRLARAGECEVRILSGEEEAEITYRGLLLGHPEGEKAMLLDIGGGSTEFTLGGPGGKPSRARSLPLGSVRQTERHIRSDPPATGEIEALRSDIRALVARGVEGARVQRLFGVAGSVTQLVALELGLDPYDPERVDGFLLSRERVSAWTERLAGMTVDARRGLIGMVPARAETVLAGAMILEETLAALGLAGVIASEYDSLWGALTF